MTRILWLLDAKLDDLSWFFVDRRRRKSKDWRRINLKEARWQKQFVVLNLSLLFRLQSQILWHFIQFQCLFRTLCCFYCHERILSQCKNNFEANVCFLTKSTRLLSGYSYLRHVNHLYWHFAIFIKTTTFHGRIQLFTNWQEAKSI